MKLNFDDLLFETNLTMEKIIKHFQVIFTAEQFVVVGSLAMYYHGLETDKSRVKDLDIVLVNPDKNTTDLLEKMVKSYPPNKKPSGVGNLYSFHYEKTNVDVFVGKKIRNLLKTPDDFNIAPINYVIDEKIKLNRPKDWIQLQIWAKTIFDVDVFNKKLKSIKL